MGAVPLVLLSQLTAAKVDAALAQCPSNSLTHLARFQYRRGKVPNHGRSMMTAVLSRCPQIYQAKLFSQMMSAANEQSKKGMISARSATSQAAAVEVEYSGSDDEIAEALSGGVSPSPVPHLPSPQECIKAFTSAFGYFTKVGSR